tara:strand:+ start:7598 stop:7801 length:204 start_codon:yes stop_codon:yes gene_type:complete
MPSTISCTSIHDIIRKYQSAQESIQDDQMKQILTSMIDDLKKQIKISEDRHNQEASNGFSRNSLLVE